MFKIVFILFLNVLPGKMQIWNLKRWVNFVISGFESKYLKLDVGLNPIFLANNIFV